MARGYELAETEAAILLSAALERARTERGLSIRQIAKLLDLKQAVVLSHMALGRMPIPIDRAIQLAELLEMDSAEFLGAVVHQRHPDVNWALLSRTEGREDVLLGLAADLEQIAGQPIRELSAEHRQVLREVVSSARPSRRWISEHEMPVIEILRKLRPAMRECGLDERDRATLIDSLTKPTM